MRYLLFIALVFPSLLRAQQNSAPSIQLTQLQVDTNNNSIQVQYNLMDADNDTCLVRAYLSGDSGISYQIPVNLTGDVGMVLPSNGKNLQIQYNIADISASAGFNAANHFHLKLIATDLKNKNIHNIIAQIDSAMVYKHLSYMEGVRHHSNPTKKQEVKDSIENALERNGYQLSVQNFVWNNINGQNFIGRKQGILDEKKTIIVHGHHDGVANSPAADDNATALAGTLIAAEVLAPYYFSNSLNMMSFDLEELGLRGAQAFINTGQRSYEEYAAMLNMEMIGYRDTAINTQIVPAGFAQLFPQAVDSINSNDRRGIFLFNISNANSAPLAAIFDSCARAYVPGIRTVPLIVPGNGTIAPDLRRSDHAVFWDSGYQALMLTDGADTRNMNYHQPSDSIGTLDFPYLIENIKAVVATAAHLAQPIDADTSLSGYFALNVDESLGIEGFNTQKNHRIWVSPTGTQIYVALATKSKCYEKTHFTVIDAQGKKIPIKSMSRDDNYINLQLAKSLSAGMYVLQSQDCAIAQKFVMSEKKH